MKKRILISLLMIAVCWAFAATFGHAYRIARIPAVGSLAGDQLADSNAAYVKSMYAIDLIKGFDPVLVALVLLTLGLALVWKGEIRKIFGPAAVVLVCLLAVPGAGNAYYSKMDYAEVVEILPNQTAFLIPETGANKTNQAAFMSVDYLNANKVAMKRVTVPHVKLENSSLMSDYYVPAARLLIVDRTPSSREWVSTANRGTNAADQGFRFESKESINIETGVVISAFVKEEDAAKFVYWFGSKAQAEIAPNDNEARFASVIYGRSLADVIDDNVRRKVQSVLAREFGKLTLVEAAAHKADVIATVEKEVKDTFAPMGITISFVGYAEGLSYDKDIQDAINNVFLATKKSEAAQQLITSVPYEQAMVNINFINAQAYALKKAADNWKGELNLPSWVIIPAGLMENLTGWIGKGKHTEPEAKAQAK